MSDAPWYTVAQFKARWAEVKRSSALLEGPSLADRLALAERDESGTIGRMLDELGPERAKILAFERRFWLRPKQLAFFGSDDWLLALLIAGRGFGKTRPAAEWILDRLERGSRVFYLVGPSYDDIRQFMLGGYKKRIDGGNGSGLLDVLPPWIRVQYKEDVGELYFPDYGAVGYLHSAEVPELRGPEPDSVWGDEPIKWRYAERLISNIRLACRAVGPLTPQFLMTTSPKRLRFLRDAVMEAGVLVVHGTSSENIGNTHAGVFEANKRRMTATDGTMTRQGQEELEGELGVDEDGELFPLGVIDANRVTEEPDGGFDHIVVAVDPAGSKTRKSDKTGIVAAGRKGDVNAGHGYVLADKTARYTWDAWGEQVVKLAEKLGASAIVIERNKFADAVAANIRTAGSALGWRTEERPGYKTLVDLVKGGRRIKIIEVLAMGDKSSRAEPVSTLYKTGRVHHVGHLTDLESEQSEWDPSSGESPNAMDALVHGMTELFSLDKPPTTPSAKPSDIAKANAQLDRSAPNRGAQRLPMGYDRRRTI